jgi:hypothetical protein
VGNVSRRVTVAAMPAESFFAWFIGEFVFMGPKDNNAESRY